LGRLTWDLRLEVVKNGCRVLLGEGEKCHLKVSLLEVMSWKGITLAGQKLLTF
jgi:hypothetical protein